MNQPNLLDHLVNPYAQFLAGLEQAIRKGLFARGLPIEGERIGVSLRSFVLLPPLCTEGECLERRVPFTRRMLVDLDIGGGSYQSVILGNIPALTGGGTLLYGEEPTEERAIILGLGLRPEVRLARVLRRGSLPAERRRRLIAVHNDRYDTAWTEDQLTLLDTSADLVNYRVTGLHNLLSGAVQATMKAVSAYWSTFPLRSASEVDDLLLPSLCAQFDYQIARYLIHSGLVQPLDTTNPLSEISHKRKVTYCGPGGVRSLHGLGTPERAVHFSQIGRICPVETPESVHIGLNLHLAEGAVVSGERIEAGAADKLLGVAASLIPFVEHDDMNRAMMGAKNMKQALPLLRPEAALVYTGMERRIIAEGAPRQMASVDQGELALGTNLIVAYLPWYGDNFEDAIVVSSRVVEKDWLTSLHEPPGGDIEERRLRIGDKLTGRHGNKGVVSRIVPADQMPQLKDGTAIDVLLNPHGVISRMNVGQLLETHWGWIARRRGTRILAAPFSGAGERKLLENAWAESGSVDGKEVVTWERDGRACRARVTVGVQYLMKLDHCAADKLSVRASGRRTQILCQPIQGKARAGLPETAGGQRIGEMETWALIAHSAHTCLEEMLTVKSDLADGPGEERLPEATRALVQYLRAMGIAAELEGPHVGESPPKSGPGFHFRLADETRSALWAQGRELTEHVLHIPAYVCEECGPVKPVGIGRTRRCPNGCGSPVRPALAWHPDGLMGRAMFGPGEHLERERGALIRLEVPVPHPLFSAGTGASDLRALYVPPPAYRPTSFRSEGLNAHYRRILAANASVRARPDSEPDRRALIGAVAALFGRRPVWERAVLAYRRMPPARYAESLPAQLEGKRGLVRGHLLGKRVDYSGRAVIVPDASLAFGTCRLPKAFSRGWNDWPGGVVLLNRAPTLHRYSLLAFETCPKQPFHAENVIALHPLACGGFGADFDGDTMAVHLVISESAQAEARSRLAAGSHLFSIAQGELTLHLAQDIVAGVYLLSGTPEGLAEIAGMLGAPSLEAGPRLEDGLLKMAVGQAVRGGTDDRAEAAAMECIDTLMRRAFQEAAERAGALSIGMSDLWRLQPAAETVSAAVRQSMAAEGLSPDERKDALRRQLGAEIVAALRAGDPEDPIAALVLSGARGSADQLARLCGAVVLPPEGRSARGYAAGLTPEEYRLGAAEARLDMMQKKLGTPTGGDLTRKLVFGLFPVRITALACEDREGVELPAALFRFLLGRIPARDADGIKAGTGIDASGIAALIASTRTGFRVFSPLTCSVKNGVCARCYGQDPSTRSAPEIGLPVGILAAQSIGERATQDFMKVFQAGQAGATARVDVAKALLEWGHAEGAPESEVGRLDWLVNVAYGGKADPRHFEIALRVSGGKGLARAARDRPGSPLAQAAFQSPIAAFARAAQLEQDDPLDSLPATLFLGRAGKGA